MSKFLVIIEMKECERRTERERVADGVRWQGRDEGSGWRMAGAAEEIAESVRNSGDRGRRAGLETTITGDDTKRVHHLSTTFLV